MKHSSLLAKVCLIILILSSVLYANAQQRIRQNSFKEPSEQTISHVPGQIVIAYHCDASKSTNQPVELLSEYDNIKSIVQGFGFDVKNAKPVFRNLVNEMLEKNLTEQQVLNTRNRTLKSGAVESDFSRHIIIQLEDEKNVMKAIQTLKEQSAVFENEGFNLTIVEPNYLYSVENDLPNDSLYNKQWGLKTINCEAAWKISKGDKKVKIAFIDSGLDVEHEDLKENVSEESFDFVDVNIEDYELAKYSWIEDEDYSEPDNDVSDYNGHGTHVTGIAGAIQNNLTGISGVCPNATLMMVRAGFSVKNANNYELGLLETDDIANALIYATDHGADIISMSFGSGSDSEILHESIRYAYNSGVTIIASSGNHSTNSKSYPAAFEEVIAVSGVDDENRKAKFSTYGDWIDVIAPGTNIYSTVPKNKGICSHPSGYMSLSGTSMAAPFVAGIAALLKSINENLGPEEIRSILMFSASFPLEEGMYYGSGVVDANKALLKAQPNDLNATFTNPLQYEIYNEQFEISGKHNGEWANLSIGKGYYPDTWLVLQENITSENFIFYANEEFEENVYTLKMEVHSQSDSLNFYHRFFIGDLKDMQTGWPVKLEAKVENEFWDASESLAVGDLNSDGLQEVIVVSNLPIGVDGYVSSKAIYVLNHKGELVDGWPYVLPNEGDYCRKPIIVDVDKDGYKEIILLSRCRTKNYLGKDQILVLNKSGTIKKGWPVFIDSGELEMNIAVQDINGDDEFEVIAGSGTASCSSCIAKGIVHVLSVDGNYLEGWPVTFEDSYVPRGRFSIANIDEDKELEIVITKFNLDMPNDSLNKVCAFNYDGSVLWEDTLVNCGWGWCQATADFNSDGFSEIMSQVGLYSNTGEIIHWDKFIYAFSDISIANVDDDSEPEICYGADDGRPTIVNSDGTNVQGWPVSDNKDNSADRGIFVADVAGDDKPEIIPLYQPNFVGSTVVKPGLNIYTSAGELVEGFPRFKNVYDINELDITDLDNDGDVEIVALDAGKNTILVLDMEKRHNRATQEWPSRFNDNYGTNNYYLKNDTTNICPVIVGQQQVLIRENFVVPTLTDLIIEDPDNDFPRDFYLMVQEDPAYNRDGNVIYPYEDVKDSLIVPVKVSDGLNESEIFPMVIKTPHYVSVNEKKSPVDFEVYPNPFNTEITLLFLNQSFNEIYIELLDIGGRLIDSKRSTVIFGQNKFTYLPSNDLNAGMYFLKFRIDDYSFCKKLIKK